MAVIVLQHLLFRLHGVDLGDVIGGDETFFP